MPQTNTPQIVQRLWNFCDVLRDDGVSYGDYVEQLTYLLFLKMDQERREVGESSAIPEDYQWERLLKDEEGTRVRGQALINQYQETLRDRDHLWAGPKPHFPPDCVVYEPAMRDGEQIEMGL